MNRCSRLFAVLVGCHAVLPVSVRAEDELSRFGFQDVFLNMPFESVPASYKGDCSASKDKRFVFCIHKALVGTVPMTVEFTFADGRVSEIHAHFPSSEFDAVWLALRQKYGNEDQRDQQKVEWYSNPMHPEKPIPDELSLHRKPKDQPKPDGTYYMPSTDYSLLLYESYAVARDAMKRRAEERDKKVRGIAEKL